MGYKTHTQRQVVDVVIYPNKTRADTQASQESLGAGEIDQEMGGLGG
jgi:hypothetical protein